MSKKDKSKARQVKEERLKNCENEKSHTKNLL